MKNKIITITDRYYEKQIKYGDEYSKYSNRVWL